MKTTISLKQLRTDPREYVRLLNSGYEVSITEHRRTIARARQPSGKSKQPKPGNIDAVLKAIDELPPIKVLDPNLDTVEAVKKAKLAYLERKYNGH